MGLHCKVLSTLFYMKIFILRCSEKLKERKRKAGRKRGREGDREGGRENKTNMALEKSYSVPKKR